MKNAHTHLKGHAHFWLLLKRKLPSRIIEGQIIEFSTVLRYLVTIVQSYNNNMNTCNNYSYLIFGPGAHAVCPQSHCPAQDLFSIATVIILPGQVWHDNHNARHQWGPTQHSLTGCGIKICYTDESSFSNQLDRFPKCVVYVDLYSYTRDLFCNWTKSSVCMASHSRQPSFNTMNSIL